MRKSECPAVGKTCGACKGKDHFPRMCPLKIDAVEWEPEDNASISESDEPNSDSDCVPLIDSVFSVHEKRKAVSAKMIINGKI